MDMKIGEVCVIGSGCGENKVVFKGYNMVIELDCVVGLMMKLIFDYVFVIEYLKWVMYY